MCGLHQVPGDQVGQCMARRNMAAEEQCQDHPELLAFLTCIDIQIKNVVMGTRRKTQVEKQIIQK